MNTQVLLILLIAFATAMIAGALGMGGGILAIPLITWKCSKFCVN